jgi:molybdopterin molybdotransferase
MVMTGAACPPGTEAVVPKEMILHDQGRVTLPTEIHAGMNVVARGGDCPARSEVLSRGSPLTPLACAVLATVGQNRVEVIPRPHLAIIVTGRELAYRDERPETHQIRDSNGPMLEALAAEMGVRSLERFNAEDTEESLDSALAEAEESDLLLLTGGVSVGKYDLVPDALKRYGARVVFHWVKQKPGKPLLFARKGAQAIFGLPGNPLAAHLCFHRYVAAALRKMGGLPFHANNLEGVMTERVALRSDRTTFLPALAEQSTQGWQWTPLGARSTADLFSTVHAQGYLCLPEGKKVYERGDSATFTWLGDRGWTI